MTFLFHPDIYPPRESSQNSPLLRPPNKITRLKPILKGPRLNGAMASFAVNIYLKNGQTSESVGESLECFLILSFFCWIFLHLDSILFFWNYVYLLKLKKVVLGVRPALTTLIKFEVGQHSGQVGRFLSVLEGVALWENSNRGSLQRDAICLKMWPLLEHPIKYGLPSRGLTYPTLGKGKSSSKWHFWGIC